MSESKYSKVLTIVLIIVGIAILGLLAFLGYDIYKQHTTKREAEEVVDEFFDSFGDQNPGGTGVGTNPENGDGVIPVLNEELVTASSGGNSSSSSSRKRTTYKGYNVVGTIEIPKISLKYPILERVTKESIETSVAMLQPSAGPNKVGNTTIVGHNYRNGSFFGSNKKLSNGDKIYITDTSGTRLPYKIYNIYRTSPDDAEYMTRDTEGRREISLSTCTDNSKERLIIWAAED